MKKKIEYNDDGKKHGILQTWHFSGIHKSVCRYKNGKLDGTRQEWYKNDRIRLDCHYVAGKLDGVRKTWYSNGKFRSACEYKNGKRHGCSLKFHWNSKGVACGGVACGVVCAESYYIEGVPTYLQIKGENSEEIARLKARLQQSDL